MDRAADHRQRRDSAASVRLGLPAVSISATDFVGLILPQRRDNDGGPRCSWPNPLDAPANLRRSSRSTFRPLGRLLLDQTLLFGEQQCPIGPNARACGVLAMPSLD